MTDDEATRVRLRVCSAIITNNHQQLQWAVDQKPEVVGEALFLEAAEKLATAPVPGENRLVNLTRRLPAWVQFVGQRSVLLFPKLTRRILRSSGIHHESF